MPDANSIVQAVIAIATPLGAIIGLGGRRRRLRHDIRENLALLEELEKNEVLSRHSPAPSWLHGRITLDVARLAGVRLGPDKTPIQWGTVIFVAIMMLGFGGFTYYLVRDGFVWYSVFPGVAAALFGISLLGLTTGREKPPEDTSDEQDDATSSDPGGGDQAEPDARIPSPDRSSLDSATEP